MMLYKVMALPALLAAAGDESLVSYKDFEAIITAMTSQITVSTVVGVVAAGIGACIGLVFMWWGARKVSRMFNSAWRKGKMKV